MVKKLLIVILTIMRIICMSPGLMTFLELNLNEKNINFIVNQLILF